MKVTYPVKDKTSKGASNTMGFYPLGSRHCWHGGLHIEGTKEIQCMADGHIIAYRLPSKYLSQTIDNKEIFYSNGFVLVQHNYRSPKGQELFFYTLYNHLKPKKEYKGSDHIPIPFEDHIYFAGNKTQKCKGMKLWDDDARTTMQIIPQGTLVDIHVDDKLVATGNLKASDEFRKVVYTSNWGKTFSGFMATHKNYGEIIILDGGIKQFRINGVFSGNSIEGSRFYKDEALQQFKEMIPKGTELKVIIIMPNGTVGKVTNEKNNESGYVKVSELNRKSIWKDSLSYDEVVNCKIPIKAGQLVGYSGSYGVDKQDKYVASHIELFTDDEENLTDFLANIKKDGIDGEKVINPHAKIMGKLETSLQCKLLDTTQIKFIAEKDGYCQIEIGNAILVGDRNSDFSNEYTEYKDNKYTIIKKNPNFYGGFFGVGEELLLLDDPLSFDKTSTAQPRNLSYNYPLSGQKVWIEKSRVAKSEPSAGPVFSIIAQFNLEGAPQQTDIPGVDAEYRLNPPAPALNSFIYDLYVEHPRGINPDENKLDVELIMKLSECKMIVQDKTKRWYFVNTNYQDSKGKNKRVKGYLNSYKMDIFPPHNWDKFGFAVSKSEKDKNKYILNYDSSSDLFREIWDLIDTDNDKGVSDAELSQAMHNPALCGRISKLVCHHRSEWAYDDAGAMEDLKKEIGDFYAEAINVAMGDARQEVENKRDDKIKLVEEKAKNLSFWSKIKVDTSAKEGEVELAAFPGTPHVFHFNPIAFVEQMECMKIKIISPTNNPRIGDGVKLRNVHPVTGQVGARHKGVDITNHLDSCNGKPVYAPIDGTITNVINSNATTGAGTYIVMIDVFGNKHKFMHLQYNSAKVVKNDFVMQGHIIGLIGSTGGSTGPHLHYEIRDEDDLVIDPLVYNNHLCEIAKLSQGTLDDYYQEWLKYKKSLYGSDLSNIREFNF